MALRRILYAALLGISITFYMLYREWLSWILLLWVMGLPLLSLVLSLPAMLSVRFRFRCPEHVSMGQAVKPELTMRCKFPAPLIRCQVQTEHAITAEKYLYGVSENLLTTHCGAVRVQVWRLWVYDYMGLFRRRIRKLPPCTMVVQPTVLPMEQQPQIQSQKVCAWKPKHGGGLAESHELRLYRPGDDLRQLHWKLSAKTGKLILREPMEPREGKLVLSVILSGSIVRIDEKLGKLLWLSRNLLSSGHSHYIQCLSANGLQMYPVTDQTSLEKAMVQILSSPITTEITIPSVSDALWQYHVGGEDFET